MREGCFGVMAMRLDKRGVLTEYRRVMRPLAFAVFVLLGLGGVLRAQDDPKMDAILNPDLNAASQYQAKTFYSGGGNSEDSTKSANVKSFYFVQKFSAKSFDTKAFDTRDYWGGEFQYPTKAALVKTDSAVGKVYDTKAAPVKEAHESGKEYGVKGYATREAVERGKTSQAHLDEEYKGKSEMNIDQVRDLLNRNKW